MERHNAEYEQTQKSKVSKKWSSYHLYLLEVWEKLEGDETPPCRIGLKV